ncbi:hypothetical protein CMI37_37450 [Candidatus Pacearchaeota archaeon]|nr:hypothetical protein [Candidatus Pacearchaeota archaeon]|tara:strand:+ start:1474 stop:1932 length:459 start_codon:yes stop_codon:yes gene_type:complete
MMLQTVNREIAEKVYIVVLNNQSAELAPGEVVEWDVHTTDSYQGYAVELVDEAINASSGIAGNKVAGVVDSTIATDAVGVLQVYGAANVRASASIDGGNMVVAGSINATNIGHVSSYAASTDDGLGLIGALVGWTLEAGPNATNATVMLSIL